MKEKLKRIIKQVWNCFFEIFMWFMLIWLGALAITFSFIFYKLGIVTLIFAVIFTFVPKIIHKIENTEG